jgi:hypothetical protein
MGSFGSLIYLRFVVFAAPSVDNEIPIEGLQLVLRVIGDEASTAQPVVRLPSASGAGADIEDEVKAGPILFMLPGVEGAACVLEPLAKNLKYQTVCLQLNYSDIGQTIHDMAQSLLPVCIARPLKDPFICLIKSGNCHWKFELLCRNYYSYLKAEILSIYIPCLSFFKSKLLTLSMCELVFTLSVRPFVCPSVDM